MLVLWVKQGEEIVLQVDDKEAVFKLPLNKYRMKVVIDAPAEMVIFRRNKDGKSDDGKVPRA